MLTNLLATLENSKFWSLIKSSFESIKSLESQLNPFLIVPLIGQHILKLNHQLEASILLDCCLKMNTDALKFEHCMSIKSSIYASLAVAYWKLDNKYDLAIDAMKNDLNCVIKLNDLNGQCRAFNNLGLAYYQLGNFVKSLENYKAQLDVAKMLSDKLKIIETLKSISNVQQELKQYENAIDTIEEYLKLAKQQDDLNSILKGLRSLSYSNAQLANYEKAIYFQDQLCKLIDKISYLNKLKPKASLELSELYEQIEDYQSSIDILVKLKVDDKKLESIVNERMANANFKLKNYQLSIDLNEKLLSELKGHLDSKDRQIRILNNLAECYLMLNDYNKSIECLKEQLNLSECDNYLEKDKNYHLKRLDAMKRLSICYKRTNQLDDTLKLYFDILNYSKQINDLDSELWSFFAIGHCYFKNCVYEEAILIFKEYLTLLDDNREQLNGEEREMKIYNLLALTYFKINDFSESFNYFKKDVKLIDELKNQLKDLTINLDNLHDLNELKTCTKICSLLIGSSLDDADIVNSLNELSIR